LVQYQNFADACLAIWLFILNFLWGVRVLFGAAVLALGCFGTSVESDKSV